MGDDWKVTAANVASISMLLGWANNLLPIIATLVTIGWTGLRFYREFLEIRQMKAKLQEQSKEDQSP